MRALRVLAILSLSGLSAALIAAGQAAQSGAQQASPAQSSYVLKVRTRLVTLDVIATDSQGNPVRDLTADELQVFEERNKRQNISSFEFVDTAANAAAARRRPALPGTNVYSNVVATQELQIPPTVLLMDALNTIATNQQRARAQMLDLLRTLPQDTPVAVFLLGNTPRLLQGFTSDPALLRAAVERAMGLNPNRIERNAQDDPNSPAQLVADVTDPELIDLVHVHPGFLEGVLCQFGGRARARHARYSGFDCPLIERDPRPQESDLAFGIVSFFDLAGRRISEATSSPAPAITPIR